MLLFFLFKVVCITWFTTNNFFHYTLFIFTPYTRSKILFWLTQISFLTTTAKYVVALLLSADIAEDSDEQSSISVLLITLDVSFLISSVLAIIISICVLRARIKQIQKDNTTEINDISTDTPVDTPVGTSGDTPRDTTVDTPVDTAVVINSQSNEDAEVKNDEPDETNSSVQLNHQQQDVSNNFAMFTTSGSTSRTRVVPVTARRSSVARIRSARSQRVHEIHEEHLQSQITLDASIEMKGRKQRRKTQLRLQARTKLKNQKILSKIPAFAALNETEIDCMIDKMVRECHLKGTVLCQQGQVADKFYVVMNGECNAYVKKEGKKIRSVGMIKTYGFFGESSLLSEPGVDDIRNATVEVSSDSSSLLVLNKVNFYKLIEDGKLNRDVLKGVKKVDLERQEQNAGGEGGDGENLV